MPFAVTHVLSAIIFVDLFRDYIAKHKKYFTLHTVFIAGFLLKSLRLVQAESFFLLFPSLHLTSEFQFIL